ncbi:hypothetical protein, partial [Pedobacter sp. ASV12]|uniref:hypothetical protein n=1 Tax=Pedobacter sp. ASV12 TaxID=2795120 RepID=UPI001E647820
MITSSTQYTNFYNTYVTPYGSIDNVPTYDWLDAVSRKGTTQNYELNVRGGTEKTRFYVSGAFNKQ